MADVLSVRVALARGTARVVRQIERLLAAAVATGRDARAVAADVARFVNPWFAPRRAPTGRVLRAGRAAGSWPAKPGMASAPARQAAVDAINRSHGAKLVSEAQRTAGVRVKWNLAPGHRDADECDGKASADNGWGPGVYDPRSVPVHPSHVGCRCVLSAVAA